MTDDNKRMPTMDMKATVEEYIDAWNAQDGQHLSQLFDETGTYLEPTSNLPASPWDLPTVMSVWATAFPDLVIESTSTTIGDNRAVVVWAIKGTNKGPVRPNLEPTGKSLHLQGVEILEFKGEKILRAIRIFDVKTMMEQLGFQVLIEPRDSGKVSYGYSIRASSGNPKPPGIIALTWIRGRDEAERDRIRGHSRKVIGDFLAEPGFIGIATGFAGDRGFTVTAWEDEDSLHRALDKQHAIAKQEFRAGDLSPGVWTSVWQPLRMNRLWTRCMACQQPNNVNDNHRECSKCGTELPPRPTFW